MRTINAILISTAALAAAVSCSGNKGENALEAQEEKVVRITTVEAAVKEVPQEEVYTSTVSAYAVNNIAPQGMSRIQKLNYEIGDFVTKGQILAEMDKVSLEQTRSKMINDSTEFARISELYAQGAVSKSDFEAMELLCKTNRITYANLLENTILRSPISGVISARGYDKGDMYSGVPVYVVEQISPVKVLVNVSESDYSRIKKGEKVQISAEALPGNAFTGTITRIYPTVDQSSRTVTVEVQVPNNDRVLRPGMFARVTVNYGASNHIVIPEASIVKLQGSSVKQVYVVEGDRVSLREIKPGRFTDGGYEILEGLEEGEIVALKGVVNLRDGRKVEIVNE